MTKQDQKLYGTSCSWGEREEVGVWDAPHTLFPTCISAILSYRHFIALLKRLQFHCIVGRNTTSGPAHFRIKFADSLGDSEESNLGNSIADSMAAVFNDTTIAIINNGGIRYCVQVVQKNVDFSSIFCDFF